MNSETPGNIIDRLSINALKIFHMEEETKREGVGDEHILKTKEKLSIVDIIIANREGAKVELYYPFNMQNNIEENDPEFWNRAAEAYLTGNKDEFLRQNTNPSPNCGYIVLGSSILIMLIAIVEGGGVY